MPNAMQILEASVLTLEVIKDETRDPKEILETLIAAEDCNPEKLAALMGRSDVTGFLAHQLLKTVANKSNYFIFQPILNLYIEKFIKNGTQQESLRYAVMTAQLWIHFIGSSHELKSKEAEKTLPQIKPVLVALIERWPKYKKSAIELIKDIEQYFYQRSYNAKSTFPGDNYSPFYYDWGNFVESELRIYILPFISKTLIELFQVKNYYKKPAELYALATRENFGHGNLAGKFYLKLAENSFTLTEIEPLIGYRPGDATEVFLLSSEGAVAKARFKSLCENAPAAEVLSLLHCMTHYAEFNFSENKAFQKLSLEEKADFIKPYSSRLESNSRDKQLDLLTIWINDPEWKNPTISTSKLIQLALRKRHIFSLNAGGLFVEMMKVLLARDEKNVIVNTLIEACFIKQLTNCLSDYNDDDAWEAVILAQACNDKNVIELIVKRNLSIKQTSDLMKRVEIKKHYFGDDIQLTNDKLIIELLKTKLLTLVGLIESDYDCLQTAIYLLDCHREHLLPETILEPVLARKSFSDLSLLLKSLEEIIDGGVLQAKKSPQNSISNKTKGMIQEQIQNWVESHFPTPEEAFLFCQHPVFASNYANWNWYYSKYPLKSLDEFNSLPLNNEDKQGIFLGGCRPKESKARESLLAVLQEKSLNEVSIAFMSDYCFKFHEHHDWAKLTLQDRLNLFTPEHKKYYKQIIASLAYDFDRLWKEEEWTAEKYLEEIKQIDYWQKDELAALAVKLI